MRRLVVLLTVVALMMVMLAMSVAPAFAVGPGTNTLACEQVASHGGPHLPPFCRT